MRLFNLTRSSYIGDGADTRPNRRKSSTACYRCQDFEKACAAHIYLVKRDPFGTYGQIDVRLHDFTADLVKSAEQGCQLCRCWLFALLGECLTAGARDGLLISKKPVIARSPETAFENIKAGVAGARAAYYFRVTSTVHADMRLEKLSSVQFAAITDDQQTGSNQMARSWLESCHRNHKSCNELSVDHAAPTRLLAVSETLVRLVNGRTDAKYMALSYCWGGEQAFMLTSQTEHDLRQSIAITELSTSIQDAIGFCRELDILFLWVDALCIIQKDSGDDWNREALSLHRTYGNAHVTLSLASASSAMEGVSRHESPQFEIDPMGCKLFGDMYPIPTRKTLAHIRTQTPLASRGWIFQEEFLSPRIIYWSNQGLFWSCSEGTQSENGTAQHGRDDLFPQLKVPTVMNPHGFATAQDPLGLWDDMIMAYSERVFTNERDRLPAVAGLAALIEQRTGEEYLEGLWWSRLPAQLLWVVGVKSSSRTSDRQLSVAPTEPNAPPSWSWASVQSGREIVMSKQASARALYEGSSRSGTSLRLHLCGKLRALTSGLDRLKEYPSMAQGHVAGMRFPGLQDQRNTWSVNELENQILVCREWTKPIIISIDGDMPTCFDNLVCFEVNYIGLLLLRPIAEYDELSFRRIGCAVGHSDAGFFDGCDSVSITLL